MFKLQHWPQFCSLGGHTSAIDGLEKCWKKNLAAKISGDKAYIELVKESIAYQYPTATLEYTVDHLNASLVAFRPNNWQKSDPRKVTRTHNVRDHLPPVQWEAVKFGT